MRLKKKKVILIKKACTHSDGKFFNCNTFKLSFKFASSIYDGKITLEEARKDQYNKMLKQLKDLEKYNPKNPDKINSRKKKLMQRNCIITGIMSLKHLKIEFFHLRVDFDV